MSEGPGEADAEQDERIVIEVADVVEDLDRDRRGAEALVRRNVRWALRHYGLYDPDSMGRVTVKVLGYVAKGDSAIVRAKFTVQGRDGSDLATGVALGHVTWPTDREVAIQKLELYLSQEHVKKLRELARREREERAPA